MTENSRKRFKTFKIFYEKIKNKHRNRDGLLQGHKNHKKMQNFKKK